MDEGALQEEELMPDENGCIDISNKTWITLDASLWTHCNDLLNLNISNNRLRDSFSPLVGQLQMLRVLDISQNRIQILPDSIKNCQQLRILNVGHNELTVLPKELCQCTAIQQLLVQHNKLIALPNEMGHMKELQLLNVENNYLKLMPESLCLCPKLEHILCVGNEKLQDVPKVIRGNSELVLWICKRNKEFKDKLKELETINELLESMAKVSDEEKFKLKDEILRLEAHNAKLEKERPRHYMRLKKGLQMMVKKVCK